MGAATTINNYEKFFASRYLIELIEIEVGA